MVEYCVVVKPWCKGQAIDATLTLAASRVSKTSKATLRSHPDPVGRFDQERDAVKPSGRTSGVRLRVAWQWAGRVKQEELAVIEARFRC